MALSVVTFYTLNRYSAAMDPYEVGILVGSGAMLIWLGWFWRPIRLYSVAVAAMTLFALWLYGDSLAQAESQFFLHYLLASRQAVMWMSALYVLATAAYLFGLALGSDFSDRVGSALTWRTH